MRNQSFIEKRARPSTRSWLITVLPVAMSPMIGKDLEKFQALEIWIRCRADRKRRLRIQKGARKRFSGKRNKKRIIRSVFC